MARPLRIEFPGACYHIINRGNFRFPVFSEERDRELFLVKLADFAERFEVNVRAYCIMVNHFHGYVQTKEANLGRFMQSFLTSFTVSYNRRHRTAGHVFQGRYKAFVVEDNSSYDASVGRYIHLNPACIPSLKSAPTGERQRVIRDYRWSSYAQIIGLRRCPRWLDRQSALHGFNGERLRDRQQEYAEYVEQGLTEELWEPAAVAVAQTVIGSESFADRIRRTTTSVVEKAPVRRECGGQRTLQCRCSLRDVLLRVAEDYEVDPRRLLARWSRNNEPRQVLLHLVMTHCTGRYTTTELAQRLGKISVSGLAKAHERMTARLRTDAALRARVHRLNKQIGNKSNS